MARSRARAAALARQRRVLSVMLLALALSVLVALATGWALAWWAFVVVLPVLFSYVAVLVRTRRTMAEREINLAFFGSSSRAGGRLEDVFARPGEQMPVERMVAGGTGR